MSEKRNNFEIVKCNVSMQIQNCKRNNIATKLLLLFLVGGVTQTVDPRATETEFILER